MDRRLIDALGLIAVSVVLIFTALALMDCGSELRATEARVTALETNDA